MSSEPLPSTIGRYRPLAVLGVGAMGVVYKAHDPVIDRLVAIKAVRVDHLDAPLRAEYLQRFRQEAQAAGRCNHPAIVAVHDVLDELAAPCLVMEFVEGGTLQAILKDPPARAGLDARALMLQVLGGLDYAHTRGIVHRDIKPANIMLTPAGDAKITDFGIARLSETSLTQVGDLLGTPNYMAPEQVGGIGVDHRADLFAAGAVLYEIIAGSAPFAARSLTQAILRLTGPEPAAMGPIAAAGAAWLVPVLQRALAKTPGARFASAAAFAAALRAAGAAEGPTVIVAPAPLPARTEAAEPQTAESGTTEPGTAERRSDAAPLHVSQLELGHPDETRWDPAQLEEVERSLTRHLGPMARVILARALREAGTLETLRAALARELPDETTRAAFLRDFAHARRAGSPAATHASATAAGTSLAGHSGFTPSAAALEAARAALAVHAGPIARLLVRNAASRAGSREAFFDLLCAELTDEAAQSALRRRLKQDVVPLL